MNIPKYLKVGGIKYKVVRDYDYKNSDLCGESEHMETEIRIASKTSDGRIISGQIMDQVFIHELLHAVDNVYNNNSLTEEAVDRLSQGLYQVFMDNKVW